MFKSSGRREKKSPLSRISRAISRFKMAKCGSQMRATTLNHAGNSEKEGDDKPKRNDEEEEELKNEENRRVPLNNLSLFCDRLQSFVKRLRNIQHLEFLTHDYPEILRNRLERDVLELVAMQKEINAARVNIGKQKAQRNYVSAEIADVRKTLGKTRDEESREMEKIVALYDKTLFVRWESVKTTHKPDVLKTLLTDVKCKQLALENLDALITRKLGHLKTFPSIISGEENRNDKEKSTFPMPLFPFCPGPNERKSKIPLPPPLPPPPSLAARNNARKLATQRRGRLRRQEEHLDNFLTIDLSDLPANSLVFDGPDNSIFSFTGNSPRQLASASTISSNSARSSDELAASLQEEMDSVLQALFGDLGDEAEEPPIVVADAQRDG